MTSFHLFTKPGVEIQEGTHVSKETLDNLSLKLCKRIREAKQVIQLMENAGFIPYMGLYEICFDHKKIETESDARKAIQHLGLNDEIFDYSYTA